MAVLVPSPHSTNRHHVQTKSRDKIFLGEYDTICDESTCIECDVCDVSVTKSHDKTATRGILEVTGCGKGEGGDSRVTMQWSTQ
jgi:hypothetical protein